MDRRKFLKMGNMALLTGGLFLREARLYALDTFNSSVSDFTGKLLASSHSSKTLKTVFRAQNTSWNIARKKPTQIWSFLPHTFAKPLLTTQEETVDITLHNQLNSETLGLHWHGLRVPNNMDGVPRLTQPPIRIGKNYRYYFSSPDAGTFWYHTHSNTLEQLRKGLMGPLIIREKKPYPADEDIIVFMSDWLINKNMQIPQNLTSRHASAQDGMLGNVITVNGRVNPTISVSPNSRIRLRFINGATARIFYINIPKIINPQFIAVDGNPVPVEKYRKFSIAPGMRMDIIADVPEQRPALQIKDEAYTLKNNLFRIATEGKSIRKKILTSKPQALADNPIPQFQPNKAKRYRVVLGGGAMSSGMMMGMISGLFWTINGTRIAEDADYRKPMMQIKKDRHVIFALDNNTNFAHPMHMHGHTFFILGRNGKKATHRRPTDTIFLNPGETADIGFVADNPGKWMFHCHVLDHQVSGMMGFFEVG